MLNLTGNVDTFGVKNKLLFGFDYNNEHYHAPWYGKFGTPNGRPRPGETLSPETSTQHEGGGAQSRILRSDNSRFGAYPGQPLTVIGSVKWEY